MRSIILVLFFCFTTVLLSSSKPTCYDIIYKLSSIDKCLSSRSDMKAAIAKQAKNRQDWVKILKTGNFPCNGTYFACGFTTSWVTEVYEGLFPQYSEYYYYDSENGKMAGYRQDVQNLMNTLGKFPYRIIYKIRHTGIHDHVFTVEQLPSRLGYRIYQSYKDSHSLGAWLSSNLTGLFNAVNGSIMLPQETRKMIDGFLKQMSNNKVSLANLQNLPQDLKLILPFLKYIRDVNESLIVNNFKKAWSKWGQGKVISYSDFWNIYMNDLTIISDFFKKNSDQSTPFPEEIYEKWIGLFGSADNTVFPGLPTNFIANMIGRKPDYRFEVIAKYILGYDEDQDCMNNANILMGDDNWYNKI